MRLRTVLFCLLVIYGGPLVPADDLTVDEIRERIEAIGVHTSPSVDRHLMVSGPDQLSNSSLLSQIGITEVAVEDLTGFPLPFRSHSVRILVQPDAEAQTGPEEGGGVRLQHLYSSGIWIHRVLLPDYAAADSEAGREAICAAFLSVYMDAPESTAGQIPFGLPAWLRCGAAMVLSVERRQETLGRAERLWREGRLPVPLRLLVDGDSLADRGRDSSLPLMTAYGAFVVWFSDSPDCASRFENLFRHLSGGFPTDAAWLKERFPEDDPDELWDRWLLSQRHIVRRLGSVSQEHLNTLRFEWQLRSGECSVPSAVQLAGEADCTTLAAYRNKPWFSTAIREKRYRIEILALGRAARFRTLTTAYVDVLNGLERGDPPAAVQALAEEAHRQWLSLRETVSAAGGEWVDR